MNLEKIKKILKSKKGIVASGIIVGTIVIGIIGGVLVNGASKSNDIAENNKPVVNNKKEDNKKEDNKKDKDESVVSKENNNTEDKKEEVKETESNINMPENSTSSNEIKNNNNDTNKNNGQSSSNNSSSNNSSSNSSNNASNGSTHTHSWNPITEQVHHDEVGHWEDVVVKPAWTESIPVYEDREFMICNDCGAELNASNCYDHVEEHLINGGKGSWREEWRQVQVGTNNVNHPAVTEKKWVVDKAAWTETVTVGHSCSCGATK
ncbi:MAG: hypothetical protein IJ086_01125 [Clostridium sp.]|nr:hypothetical protein [Clostridium sp.]